MELIFKEQIVLLEDLSSSEVIIMKINELVKKGEYFSHFIADGIEVYEEYEKYLETHLGKIRKLEVVLKSEKEFVNDLLLSAEEYIVHGIPELSNIAEGFYDSPLSETWARLDQLLVGLQWLDEMMMVIGESAKIPVNWGEYLMITSVMHEIIVKLAEAIENEDDVLIGDLIQYELIASFEDLRDEIKNTIDNEGVRHDLN